MADFLMDLASTIAIGAERVAWFLIKMDQPMFKTLQKCLPRNWSLALASLLLRCWAYISGTPLEELKGFSCASDST